MVLFRQVNVELLWKQVNVFMLNYVYQILFFICYKNVYSEKSDTSVI